MDAVQIPRYRRPLLLSSGGLLLLAALAGTATLAFQTPPPDPTLVGLAARVGVDSTARDSLARVAPDELGLVARTALEADATPPAVWIGGEPIVLHPSVVPLYHARRLAPAWSDRASRDTLLHALRASAAHGLDPDAYRADALTRLARALDARENVQLDADTAAADLDLALTDALFRYADDVRGARVNPTDLYRHLWADHRADAPTGLADVLGEAPSVAAWIESLPPPHPGYRRLRDALARNLDGTGPDSVSADLLRLNLERWRSLPRDLGERHVWVDVPGYHAQLREDYAPVFEMKVVVGKPGRWQTPVMTDTMETIVFSPTWIMPASIQREQYGYVRRGGRVQPPGPRNPMGRAKFLFPNNQAIYIHDTNSKRGFSREYRALSHGCVRAADPRDFATAILTRTNDWTEDAVAEKFQGRWRPQTVVLEDTLPVHLTYFTAWAAPDGTVRTSPDVYRRDAALAQALGLTL